jgi:hypothetical protein
MPKFIRNNEIEAWQWFRYGDGPSPRIVASIGLLNNDNLPYGMNTDCHFCHKPKYDHGVLSYPEVKDKDKVHRPEDDISLRGTGYDQLCPGDWLCKDSANRYFIMSDEVFKFIYKEIQ